MDYVLLVMGLILDGVGAYCVVSPIISFMNSYKAKKELIENINYIDKEYTKNAIKLEKSLLEILLTRVDNFLIIQNLDLESQKNIDHFNAKKAYLGLYYIWLGLILIITSNFIPS